MAGDGLAKKSIAYDSVISYQLSVISYSGRLNLWLEMDWLKKV